MTGTLCFQCNENLKSMKWKLIGAFWCSLFVFVIAQAQESNCLPKNFDCEISFLTKKIEKDQNNPDLFLFRGQWQALKGDHGRAIDDFTLVLILRPDDQLALHNRADAYLKLNNSFGALKDYEKLESLFPGMYLISLAIVYEKRGNQAKALHQINKLLEKSPNWPSYLVRAEYFQRQKNFELALKDFETAIEITNKSPDGRLKKINLSHILSMRAGMWIDKGNFENAMADYGTAIETDPSPWVYKRRAAVLDRLGNKARAAADREKATILEAAEKAAEKKSHDYR